MRFCFVLLLILCSNYFWAQEMVCSEKTNYESESVDSLLRMPLPNIMFRDPWTTFFKWKQKPQSFHVILFNRWGEKLDESYDPDYRMDAEDLSLKGAHLPEGDLVCYFISIRTCSGKKIELKGFAKTGWYEHCG